MGIETEQRLKRLELRIATLEDAVGTLRAATPAEATFEPAAPAKPIAAEPAAPAKSTAKTKKSAAGAGKKRST
jgi:hypothetical protein